MLVFQILSFLLHILASNLSFFSSSFPSSSSSSSSIFFAFIYLYFFILLHFNFFMFIVFYWSLKKDFPAFYTISFAFNNQIPNFFPLKSNLPSLLLQCELISLLFLEYYYGLSVVILLSSFALSPVFL